MAKITTGSTFKITAQMAMAARLMAEGHSLRDIATTLFDCVTDDGHQATDEAKVRRAVKKLRKWQENENFKDCYRAIIRELAMPAYGKAFATVQKQMDDSNAWLANKAANDVLSRFGPAIMGEEDKQIVVQVQGMPELGEPSDDD